MDGKLIGLMKATLVRRYGEALWESLLTDAEGVPSDSLACWLGRDAVPAMTESYPSLFARHPDLEGFIRGLGDDLPVAGSRDEREAAAVGFRYAVTPDGAILLRIEADCVLCALVQGVIAGAAIHYGERVSIRELKSPKRGDNACVLQITLGLSAPGAGQFLAVGNA